MDIDKKISLLEGKQLNQILSSKTNSIKIIIFFVLGSILTYIIKPISIYNIYIDTKTNEIKKELITIKFILFSIVFSIILYYMSIKLLPTK
jgi:hypothetical protein